MNKKTEALRISQMGFPTESEEPVGLIAEPVVEVFSPARAESPRPTSTSHHHPQIVDQDVDDFSTKLNTLISQFRNESMKEFMTMKRNLLHEQITSIDAERKRCNASLSAKQDEIEHLKEELACKSTLAHILEIQKERMSRFLQKHQGQRLNRSTLKLAFAGWVDFHTRNKVEKKRQKLVAARGKAAFLRRVFGAWKEKWGDFHRTKLEEKISMRVEEEKTALSVYFNKEIQMLKSRLETADYKLHQEEEAKASIQENLQKAFLRGVCAMNFEAMNLLNPSSFNSDLESSVKQELMNMNKPELFSEASVDKQFETPTQGRFEASFKPEASPKNTESTLSEIQAMIPPESKDHKWKPAPVFGRPQTAPEINSSLPSNLHKPTGNVQGKTIVVNPNVTETKVKGHLPRRK